MSPPATRSPGRMGWVLAGLIVFLFVLRQDFWNWENTDLVFGFLPAALFSQACISISASCLWWWAVTYAWPVDPDAGTLAAATTAPPIDPSSDPVAGLAADNVASSTTTTTTNPETH